MRGLRALGSPYHAQVPARWRAHEDSRAKGVCTHLCGYVVCTSERSKVCFPRPEDRNLSMAAEIVAYLGFLWIPNVQWHDRGAYVPEGEPPCQSSPLCNGHRCNISPDKGSSVWRNMLLHSHVGNVEAAGAGGHRHMTRRYQFHFAGWHMGSNYSKTFWRSFSWRFTVKF